MVSGAVAAVAGHRHVRMARKTTPLTQATLQKTPTQNKTIFHNRPVWPEWPAISTRASGCSSRRRSYRQMSTYAEGTGNPNGAAAAIHNLFCRSAALVVRAQAAEVPYRHLLSIHEEMPIVTKNEKGEVHERTHRGFYCCSPIWRAADRFRQSGRSWRSCTSMLTRPTGATLRRRSARTKRQSLRWACGE
jgi:hypothetical protein